MAEVDFQSSLKDIRRTHLQTYANDQKRISQDFKLEAADSADYSRRFVFELLQNADDEMPSSSVENRCIRFELDEEGLLVANTGRAFDVDDLTAITTLTETTKGASNDEATIGHKGRGFTSVLDVTDTPAVFSRNGDGLLAAEFDREKARRAIRDQLRASDIDVDGYTERVPLMPLPFPAEATTNVASLLDDEFTTVFRLPFSADTNEQTYETIASTLTKRITRETIALLPNTDRIELAIGNRERTWTIDRTLWAGEVDATIVEINCQGDLDDATRPERSEKMVVFSREHLLPERSFVGIDTALLDDIGRLRTSVAFGLEQQNSKTKLTPLHIGTDRNQRPFIHVFLPTEERSPIPALVNGTFQVSTARRSLNMPTDPETGAVVGLNGWLFEQAAATIAEDVLAFVAETDTTIAEFLRTIDFTAVLEDETASSNPVNRCFIDALRDALADVAFVPRLEQLASGASGFDPDPRPLRDVLVPYVHPDKERLGTLVAMIYGRERVSVEDIDVTGYFPDTSLLEPSVASVLIGLGASSLEPWMTPRVLGAASDENAVLQYRDDDDRLTVDPILYALLETWQTITDDDMKKRFTEAARTEAVFPVGDPIAEEAGPYYEHQTTPERIACFFPPQQDVPADALADIRLFPRDLYFAGGSSQADAEARRRVLEGGEFESILEAIWDINEFSFAEIADKGIYPLLPGPNTPAADDSSLRDTTVIEFIQRLACSSTSGQRAVSPDEPLPYEYRAAEQYYSLCALPLPTANGEWARAYELYFGALWQRGQPREARVEQFLSEAGIQAPILAPPERFGIDEEDDVTEWIEFFRWLGVSEHVRITPFFHPTQSHQYRQGEDVQMASESVVDPESPFSPRALESSEIEEYLDDLRTRAQEEADEDDGERPFIWQVNGLEFDYEIIDATRDESFATTLFWHLYEWWDRLSVHAEATVALYSNKRLRGGTTYLFTDEEKVRLKANLWLWQLRRATWLRTVLGQVPPKDAWLLSETEVERYSVDIDTKRYPLLPTLSGEVYHEAFEQSPELFRALSIRQRVAADDLTPSDVERFADRIYDVITHFSRDGPPLESYHAEIEAAYGYLGQELPPLENQGVIQSAEWHPEVTGLGDVQVPCFIGDELTFREASTVYFTRSHEETTRFSDLDVPIFVLTGENTPRIGVHFGMTDLVEAVEETPLIDEERTEDTGRFLENWLRPAAPYILCRLKARRSSQDLQKRDADALSRFMNSLRLVGSLEVEYSLKADGEVSPLQRSAEYFIQRDERGDRAQVYVVTESDGPVSEPPEQILAKAFADYAGLSSWEPIYVLLQNAPDQRAMADQLQAASAPSSERELNARLAALDGKEKGTVIIQPVENSSIERPVRRPLQERSDRERGRSNGSQLERADEGETVTRDGSGVPDPDQLTRIGDSEVKDVTGEATGSTHEREYEDREPEPSGRGGGSGGADSRQHATVTANYIDRIDRFGMEATYLAEIERLREEGCEDPKRYVHFVHTSNRYNEARDDELAGPVLCKLEEKGVISQPYPGFDFLIVSRDKKWPERCIEVKSSGSNSRRPSISWNEWKSASSELRETYYLYVATDLQTGKSGVAKLIQVPNPFSTLDSREQTVRSQTREVQVNLSEFHAEAGEVVERAIYWDE
ncbi:sacsin N-terminal ATP-binding-like domain-containing protein [Natronorarus salvus]|uniref:sacsin N-terminal ATP-binding-like domain-containing protein n=1 Tax=Natronorarus salvus TaxID=3117733 RepID=UPI002F2601A5